MYIAKCNSWQDAAALPVQCDRQPTMAQPIRMCDREPGWNSMLKLTACNDFSLSAITGALCKS